MTNETWSEVGLVAITKIGGEDVEFYTITSSVELTIGDKDVEFLPILNGGRLAAFKPQGDTEITLELYPLEAGTDSTSTTAKVGKGVFDLMGTVDSTQPLELNLSRTRDKYRITLLWTDDTTITNATSDIVAGKSGLRFAVRNGYVTSATPSGAMTPTDPLKWQVKFKSGAFDKNGISNVTAQSTDGTASTAMTLAAYTA